MKLKSLAEKKPAVAQLAFTLIEVAVGVALAGIVFLSLWAGLSSGFAVTQLARENLRATQILLERMEGVRLYNWEQLTNKTLLPQNFTDYYYPLAMTNESRGISYSGNLYVVPSWPMDNPAPSYQSNIALVYGLVRWTNSGVMRQRWLWTYVSRHGVQNYVYYN